MTKLEVLLPSSTAPTFLHAPGKFIAPQPLRKTTPTVFVQNV
ncbi:MAG: hypothetical protein AAFW73_10185 [Bacteroidota bacterium]